MHHELERDAVLSLLMRAPSWYYSLGIYERKRGKKGGKMWEKDRPGIVEIRGWMPKQVLDPYISRTEWTTRNLMWKKWEGKSFNSWIKSPQVVLNVLSFSFFPFLVLICMKDHTCIYSSRRYLNKSEHVQWTSKWTGPHQFLKIVRRLPKLLFCQKHMWWMWMVNHQKFSGDEIKGALCPALEFLILLPSPS